MRIHRNLIKEGRELDGDLLRQRRNVYATSLGLIVYHVAGGRLGANGEFAALRIHFTRPEWLYVIAIVALVYFLYRFWVVDPGCIERFKQEWVAQTKCTKPYRKASEHVGRDPNARRAIQQVNVHGDQRLFAEFAPRKGEGWRLAGLSAPGSFRDPNYFWPVSEVGAGLKTCVDAVQGELKLASALGFLRAIVLERSFTDLIAPYGIAAIALIVCACSALAPHL